MIAVKGNFSNILPFTVRQSSHLNVPRFHVFLVKLSSKQNIDFQKLPTINSHAFLRTSLSSMKVVSVRSASHRRASFTFPSALRILGRWLFGQAVRPPSRLTPGQPYQHPLPLWSPPKSRQSVRPMGVVRAIVKVPRLPRVPLPLLQSPISSSLCVALAFPTHSIALHYCIPHCTPRYQFTVM